jgi:predicted nucleic acid-binding protein
MNAVDTNVIIYAHDGREPRKQRIALELLRDLEDGVLLWQVACEFLAAARKLAAHGFNLAAAEREVDGFRRLWSTLLPTWSVFDRASALRRSRAISFWDSLIVAACLEGGVTKLYSEDLAGHGKIGSLEIVDPFSHSFRH